MNVGKSRRIATPLELKLVPVSIDDIVPPFNVDTQGTCPEKCSCECQISTSAFGMYICIHRYWSGHYCWDGRNY